MEQYILNFNEYTYITITVFKTRLVQNYKDPIYQLLSEQLKSR